MYQYSINVNGRININVSMAKKTIQYRLMCQSAESVMQCIAWNTRRNIIQWHLGRNGSVSASVMAIVWLSVAIRYQCSSNRGSNVMANGINEISNAMAWPWRNVIQSCLIYTNLWKLTVCEILFSFLISDSVLMTIPMILSSFLVTLHCWYILPREACVQISGWQKPVSLLWLWYYRGSISWYLYLSLIH